MVRLRLKKPHSRDWTDGDRYMVSMGCDFLREARWPCWMEMTLEDRKSWPSAEVLASMRECWADCRDEILAERAGSRKPCWGELVFDENMSPRDASEFLSEPPPEPNEWQRKNGHGVYFQSSKSQSPEE